MRDQLLGYLLGAIDDAERADLENRLTQSPEMQRELERLQEDLSLLQADQQPIEPPDGLAQRTCDYVEAQLSISGPQEEVQLISTLDTQAPPRRWRPADLAVAASIAIAATLLLFPLINHSRATARLTKCQDNLQQIASALSKYSEQRNGKLPAIPTQGNLSAAGIYAPILVENGFPEVEQCLICPESPLAERADPWRLPRIAELESAKDQQQLRIMQASMGGSYGYSLGYLDDDQYRGPRDLRRANFALMADAPTGNLQSIQSINHGGLGQNVLFEDGHVAYLKTCTAEGCQDHIFLNENGLIAAGNNVNDAVIGHSAAKPIVNAARLRRP